MLCAGFVASQALAAISITDHNSMRKQQRRQASPGGIHALATGSVVLIDASGLKYFINDNITFSTTSSASAAMSEASYTHAVAATTSGGGTTASTLNDAFDGYNTICLSFTGHTGPCATGNADYVFYNKTGSPSTGDPTCGAATPRQYLFPTQTIGNLHVSRAVFVPANDTFARWLNVFTNVGGAPVTFNVITGNNLGSDSNTKIVSSSNGNNVAELTDTWITSFQNFSGNKSSDVRLGHVLQGQGATVPLSAIHFVDGDDNPWWTYTLTLAPGQTRIIMNFVTGQPSRAAANIKAAQIAALSPNTLQCMSAAQMGQVVNFQVEETTIPTLTWGGMAALFLLLAVAAVFILRVRATT
jgi:hypothetical protein